MDTQPHKYLTSVLIYNYTISPLALDPFWALIHTHTLINKYIYIYIPLLTFSSQHLDHFSARSDPHHGYSHACIPHVCVNLCHFFTSLCPLWALIDTYIHIYIPHSAVYLFRCGELAQLVRARGM